MDEYESTRRDFLKKLGLVVGDTTLASNGISQADEIIQNKKEEFPLTPEQKKFMKSYEKWLEEFHAMAKVQKVNPDNLKNNKKLIILSDEAGKWQKELTEYMTDENFASYFMVVTERVTASIV